MDIITELKAFDGKHTDPLETLTTHLSPTATVIRALCTIAKNDDAKLQTAATWVLKRFQENSVSFSPAQIEDCLGLLNQVTYWEAKLHLLQMLPGFVISADRKNALQDILKAGLNNDNKFVRAWSYNGLSELAAQYPEFRAEVAELLETGQREEAASIRARIRNILKTYSWLNSK